MVDPEAAKRELLSAFKDVEDDGELLVAKPRGEVCDEPLSVEERYESEARFCILVRAKRDALLRRRAVQWESESANPILGHYWENEAGLDNGEKFLREGWKTRDKINQDEVIGENLSVDSDEDEEFLEKVDEFETKYNFRFEEEGGHSIASHARTVTDSVRVKENGRKRLREEKKERQESDRKSKTMELQRLKNLKKAEIDKRLKEVEQATGTRLNGLEKVLDTEFDPDTYEAEINGIIGEDYYDQADEGFQAEEVGEDEVGEDEVGEEEWTEEPAVEEEFCEGEPADCDNMWFFCDVCIRPIREGNVGFECKECEDVTVCFNCKSNNGHPSSHTLKKFKVQDHEVPPSDWVSVLYDLKKKRVKDIMKGKYDELFALDYEDLIAEDLPCRFKYTPVDSDAFGLAPEAIMTKSDKELNKEVSLRKLHPYRKGHAMKRVKYHDKRK